MINKNYIVKKAEEEHLRDILQIFCDEFLPALDCDGCTRFVGMMLENKGIPFSIYTGGFHETENPENKFDVHFWIETEQGTVFDFKTEKWIGVTSEYVTYDKKRWIPNNKKFLSLGGNRAIVLGTLLHYGVEAPGMIYSKLTGESHE